MIRTPRGMGFQQAMFDDLQKRLTGAFGRFRARGILTEANIKEGMREVRTALLEADVNYNVVQEFMQRVNERAVGTQLIKSVRPEQQIVKIVHDELVELMGPVDPSVRFEKTGPTVVMLCGLQGSGKTTTCGKLARLLAAEGRKPLLVAADLQRPAAVDQLKVTGVPVKFVGKGEKLDKLELFDPERLVGQMLGMGDIVGLVEAAQQAVDQEEAKRLQEKLGQGKFDLNDFRQQISQIGKMGSV